jgi:thymidylate kinase
MAFATKFFLEARGKHALVVSFPSESSAAYPILRLVLNNRTSLGPGATDLLFVADRLDVAFRLCEIRRTDPDMVFIFDRGPADGAVYAEASDSLRNEPIGLTTTVIEKWDSKFLRMFPVDLGIYLRSSIKTAKELIRIRESFKPADNLDKDTAIQQRIRDIFDAYMEDRQGWKVLNIEPNSGETLDNWERRIMRNVLGLVSDSADHPEWLEVRNFRREIEGIRGKISEQPLLVYKETRSVLSLRVSPERH